MNISDLIDRVAKYDLNLAKDISEYVRGRQYGLVYEASKPEFVRLWNKPIVKGDLVNVLPSRGVIEDTNDENPSNVAYCYLGESGSKAKIRNIKTQEELEVPSVDLVAIARFDQPIYCGLKEVNRVERGGEDSPYHVVINGENFHALQTLAYAYAGRVDCIYIDPPYNTGAKDWKYNNNYVAEEDLYRHSKWLTFMEDRLKVARKLLNPKDSVLIVTIDEKEYLRLGLLLEQLFPEARIQMITDVINAKGVSRTSQFSRVEEYVFFVQLGESKPAPTSDSMLDFEMTGNYKQNVGDAIPWARMLRRGSNSHREHSENCFYPIFVNETEERIVSVGNPPGKGNSRETVIVPEGCVAVWPMHSSGVEGCWQLSKSRFVQALYDGTAKLGRKNKLGQWSINYLNQGLLNEISDGNIAIIGKDEKGALLLERKADKLNSAKSVWNRKTHDASLYGSVLLSSIIGKRFSYPKSVYSEYDTIEFFVKNKPNALIVDFFAGSGTTLHAVNLLNSKYKGNRRCILVTNNEVSENEAKILTRKEYRPSDNEWKKLGIANYVTWPRTVCSIEGHDIDNKPLKGEYLCTGKPMCDGFSSNAVFYELSYVEPSLVSADCAFEEIEPLLWMRAGCVGKILHHEENYAVGKNYAILFNYSQIRQFIEIIRAKREIEHIFIVTDIKSRYRNMCMEFPNRDVIQLYESYLRSFEINTED